MAQPPPTTANPPVMRVLCANHAELMSRWAAASKYLDKLGVRAELIRALPPGFNSGLAQRAASETLTDSDSVLVIAPARDPRGRPLFDDFDQPVLLETLVALSKAGRLAFVGAEDSDTSQLSSALSDVPAFNLSDQRSIDSLAEWARSARDARVDSAPTPEPLQVATEPSPSSRTSEGTRLHPRVPYDHVPLVKLYFLASRDGEQRAHRVAEQLARAGLACSLTAGLGPEADYHHLLGVTMSRVDRPLDVHLFMAEAEALKEIDGTWFSDGNRYIDNPNATTWRSIAGMNSCAFIGLSETAFSAIPRGLAHLPQFNVARNEQVQNLLDFVRSVQGEKAQIAPATQVGADSRSIAALSSFSLSPGAQAVLDRAKAMTPPGGRWATLTTLAFLFAFKELGKETPQTQDTIHFVNRYFDRQAGARYQSLYETTVRTWMEDSPPGLGTDLPPGAWVSTITPNVLRLFERAREIARRTLARQTDVLGTPAQVRDPDHIHARHLFAALLTFEPEPGSRNSIVEKLNYLGIDLAALKSALFEIVAANTVEDDSTVWREVLGLSPASPGPSAAATTPSSVGAGLGGPGPGPQKSGQPEEVSQAQRPPETPPARKGDEAPAPPRPATFLSPFHGDDNETDRLNLKHEIDALAYLIASQSVHPPLAIGLFGEWGSGKSFFMTQLRKRISAIADAARAADAEARAAAEARRAPKIAPEDIGWHRHICQIEFNAWHYVEGNIWASLVEHIFSNLRSSLVSPKASLEAQRLQEEEFRREFETSKHALAELESRIASARKDLSNAEAAVAGARENHRLKAGLLGELKSGPTALSVLRSLLGQPAFEARLRELGLTDEVLASPARVREAIQALSAEADAWRTPLSLLSGRAIESRLLKWGLLALLIVAAPAAVFIASNLFTEFDREIKLLVGLAVQLAAVCTAVVGWIGAQAGRLAKARAKLDPVLHQLDERRSEELVRTERDLAVAKTNLDQALADFAQQQKKVEELQAQEKAATATELMAQFIEQRAACTDYRRHLGITAIVRRDFAKLTELVARRSAEARLRPVGELDRQPIDRIVLYIDDLDRCPPDKVVAVLEAIHLILAFKLFVVVVGVDARWISRSLRKKYGPLLAGRSTAARAAEPPRESKTPAAVPEDYLEKIFQIPFRLRPLTSTGTEDLLDHLLQPPPGAKAAPAGQPSRAATTNIAVQVQTQAPASDGPAPGSGGPQPVAAPAGPQDPELRPGQPVAPTNVVLPNIAPLTPTSTTLQPVQQPRAEVEAKTPVEPGVDLTPGRLELTPDEIKFMKHLAPVIGRSPRAVHRFVNCYRLLKAARDPGKLAAFESSAGPGAVPPYEAAMLMLAIIIGVPEVAGPALSMLVARVPQAELSNLIADWDRDERILAEPDWKQRIEPFLRAYARAKGKPCPVAPFREAASVVARYSFRTGMMEELEIAAGPQEPGLKPGSAPSEKA